MKVLVVFDHPRRRSFCGAVHDSFVAGLAEAVARALLAEVGEEAGGLAEPELVPAGADGAIQSTESIICPYELNDFFLHHIVRFGQRPSKVAFLAWQAWKDVEAGRWPADFPESDKGAYDLSTIAHWLEKFLKRFFAFSQFKRSAMPTDRSSKHSARSVSIRFPNSLIGGKPPIAVRPAQH